jgi:hypothetical protein
MFDLEKAVQKIYQIQKEELLSNATMYRRIKVGYYTYLRLINTFIHQTQEIPQGKVKDEMFNLRTKRSVKEFIEKYESNRK